MERCVGESKMAGIGEEEGYNFFFQAEDGIRDQPRSRGLGDVYKRRSGYRPY